MSSQGNRPPSKTQCTQTDNLTTALVRPNATLNDYLHVIYDTNQRLAREGRHVIGRSITTKIVEGLLTTAINGLCDGTLSSDLRYKVVTFDSTKHLTQKATNEYSVRVILEDLHPEGTFEVI